MPTDDSSHPNSTSTPASPSPTTTGSSSNKRFNYALLASGLFFGITGVLITVGQSIERLPAVPSVQLHNELATITSLLFQIVIANRAVIGPVLAGLGIFLGGIAIGLQIQRG